MQKLLGVTLLLFMYSIHMRGQTIQWTTPILASSELSLTSVCKAGDNHLLFAGHYYSSSTITIVDTTYQGGPQRCSYFGKISTSGDLKWIKAPAILKGAVAIDIAAGIDGEFFVVGAFVGTKMSFGTYTLTSHGGSDIYILKFDSVGNVVWGRNFGGSHSDFASSVAVDKYGDLFVTGEFNSPSIAFDAVTFQNAEPFKADLFTIKLDGSGKLLWATHGEGPNFNISNAITVDTEGSCYIGGIFMGSSIDFGACTLTAGIAGSGFVTKYDRNGTCVWSTKVVSEPLSLACDNSKNIAIGGSPFHWYGACNLQGGTDAYVAKLDSIGSLVWESCGGSSYDDRCRSVAFDTDGNLYASMFTRGYSILFADGFKHETPNGPETILVRYSPAGERECFFAAPTGWSDNTPLVVDETGRCFFGSFFDGSKRVFGSDTMNAFPGAIRTTFMGEFYCESSVSVTEHGQDEFIRVYPNPAVSEFYIQFLDSQTAGRAFLYDSFGRLVLTTEVRNSSVIDCGFLPKGVYQLVARSGSKSFSKKVLLME